MTCFPGRTAYWLLCVVVSLTTAACGSDSDPVTPTPVVPTVQGTWAGDYTVSGCNDATATGFCQGFAQVGAVLPVRIVVTQSGQQLTGTVELGQFTIPVTGTVDTAARITLNGSAASTISGQAATVTLGNWNTVVAGSNMTGGWRLTFSFTAFPGAAPFLENTIRTVTKVG